MVVIEKFNLRVYGLLLNEKQEILVVDEFEFGMQFTKFPGGGLELGEGLIDGLKREWMEELGQQIEVTEHFYTTDYFFESVFDTSKQIVSIYYLIKPIADLKVRIAEKAFDFQNQLDGAQSFRFIALNTISADQFTLSIDQHVASILSQNDK